MGIIDAESATGVGRSWTRPVELDTDPLGRLPSTTRPLYHYVCSLATPSVTYALCGVLVSSQVRVSPASSLACLKSAKT